MLLFYNIFLKGMYMNILVYNSKNIKIFIRYSLRFELDVVLEQNFCFKISIVL